LLGAKSRWLSLPMVLGWHNPKALHLVEQSRPLQAKPRRCAPRTSEPPIGTLAGGNNFSAHHLF
jgi:hypothetical protein